MQHPETRVDNPLPDFEPRLYMPHRIAAVVDTLAEDGVAPARTLEDTGIAPEGLQEPSLRVSYAQCATVFRNAQKLSPDPTFALRAGRRMHLTAYGMWGYALLSSPTCADTLEFAAKYLRVIGPLADMSYDRHVGPSVVEFHPVISTDPADDLYRLAVEFTCASHLTLHEDMFRGACGPAILRVAVAYPAPAHAKAYRRWLGRPVQFDQPANQMQYDADLSRHPTSIPDAITHALVRETCAQFLVDVAHAGGMAASVRRALIEQMPWRFPNIEAMAAHLAIAPRTLRRKLEAQGTSYREILAAVRRHLAIGYLRKTRLTNEEISIRLGYSDAANFRHAFSRWTGKTPHEYRMA